MGTFGTHYDVCPNSGKRCSDCDWLESCAPNILDRYGSCLGPGGDEPGTYRAGKIVLFKYAHQDNSDQVWWTPSLVHEQNGEVMTPITAWIMHELGHVFGLAHTCTISGSTRCDWAYPDLTCGDMFNQCLAFYDNDIYQGVMSSGPPESSLRAKRRWAYGPHAVEIKLLNSLYSTLASPRPYHLISYNNGTSWQREYSTVDNFVSNVPVSYVGNGETPWGVLALQHMQAESGLHTMRTNGSVFDNLQNPMGLKSQLGPSVAAARDMGLLDMTTGVVFLYKNIDGSLDDYSRWVDMIYNLDGGSYGQWQYQYGLERAYSRPGIGYVKSGSYYYFVVAFVNRQNSNILVHIARDNNRINGTLPTYCSNAAALTIPGSGSAPTAYGDVSVSCAPPETGLNYCIIAYIEDGRTISANVFRPSYIFGHINSSACSWVSDNSGVIGLYGSGSVTSVFQPSTTSYWQMAGSEVWYDIAEPWYMRQPYGGYWTQPYEFPFFGYGTGYSLGENPYYGSLGQLYLYWITR